MKAVYMMLSGLLLSIMATLTITGLIAIDKLVKPKANYVTTAQVEELKSSKVTELQSKKIAEFQSRKVSKH